MQVACEAVISQPVAAVWQSLTDIDGVLAVLPGAALARDGAMVNGSLKCKLGTTQVTYRVTASVEVGDPGFHTAVVSVSGHEARGSGTMTATVTVSLRSAAPDTRIEVTGDIVATGRGAVADSAAWERVLTLLVNAAVPPVSAPADPTSAHGEPAIPPRPALSVAPDPVATAGFAVPLGRVAAGAVALVAGILIARRRKVARR